MLQSWPGLLKSLKILVFISHYNRHGGRPLLRDGNFSTTPTTKAELEEEQWGASCLWKGTSIETSGSA